MELKRDLVKYIRDRAKSKYEKGTECHICGSNTKLDFHHYYTLSLLLHKWMAATNPDPKMVLGWRDIFIEEHLPELYEHAVTLCHPHHLQLHGVYGRNPNLGTAKKQMRWVQIQREKNDLV